MTANDRRADVDHRVRNAVSPGLFTAFGAAAAASARQVTPRPRRRRHGGEAGGHADDHADDHAEEPNDRGGPSEPDPNPPTRQRQVPPSEGPSPVNPAPRPRRRVRTVAVRERWHIQLLLLAVAAEGPRSGGAFRDLVHERSGGVFDVPDRIVYRELQRLRQNRLLDMTFEDGRRRYHLTRLGERILTSRRLQWETFRRGFDGVLEE
jgi:DNA-binding PadR family transcriptional regulator